MQTLTYLSIPNKINQVLINELHSRIFCMNITELARRLRITTKQLKEELPKLGFDIGGRAIKIDDRAAEKVIKLWNGKLRTPGDSSYVVVEKKIGEQTESITKIKEISLPKILTTKELADLLSLPVTVVITELFKNGVMASINERIDYETAAIIAQDLGYQTKAESTAASAQVMEAESAATLVDLLREKEDAQLETRPPVVVVMGHVDHGKTKLLDAIRETNVVDQESGAITQHIGAYQAETKGRLITFLDTPGHEAFAAMRSRGGRLADLGIIMVAADDGMQPQTVEAIQIAQREELPFLVAINKIDKTEADIERIKKQLAEHNLLPEDWGGKTICVPISAKQKINLDNLLEMVLLLADIEKLQADPRRPAVGTVIESHIDKGQGAVATVLVQTGTLKLGDYIVVGQIAGRIRAMKSFTGKNLVNAGPSTPVKILGLKQTPTMGDVWQVVKEEQVRQILRKTSFYQPRSGFSVSSLIKKEETEESPLKPTLKIVLKTDMLGSREAIMDSLAKISNTDAKIEVVKTGLGNINETDIVYAEGVRAIILGFHVSVVPQAQSLAKEKNIFTATYTVIYDLLDEAKKHLITLIKPELVRTQIGQGKVVAIFRQGKKETIVGVKIMRGLARPDTKVKILRGEGEIFHAKVIEIRLGKEQIKEMSAGGECGVCLQGQLTIQTGDILEFYHEEFKHKTTVE